MIPSGYDDRMKSIQITDSGRALISAIKTGLIQETENGYDEESVKRFIEEMEQNKYGFRVKKKQLDLLLSHEECAYFSISQPEKYCSCKRKNSDYERKNRYVSIGSFILCLFCLAVTIFLKFL